MTIIEVQIIMMSALIVISMVIGPIAQKYGKKKLEQFMIYTMGTGIIGWIYCFCSLDI